MSAHEQPQKYSSWHHFAYAHGITHPPSEFWRLTPRLMGQINGLPGSRGWLTATNGILCYIEQESAGRIETYLGHIAWFVPDGDDVDMDEVANAARPKSAGAKRRERKEQQIQEMLAAYE